MSRNAIFDALIALGAGITTPSTGPMLESGRRLRIWDKSQKPAIYQVEPDDQYTSKLGTLTRRTFDVTWVIYHDIGKSQSSTPSAATADILDAIDAILPSANGYYQTLGGIVVAAYINGRIRKFEGDIDGHTIITVPISILVP